MTQHKDRTWTCWVKDSADRLFSNFPRKQFDISWKLARTVKLLSGGEEGGGVSGREKYHHVILSICQEITEGESEQGVFSAMVQGLVLYFLSTLFKSNRDDGMVTMKVCEQWSTIQLWAKFCSSRIQTRNLMILSRPLGSFCNGPRLINTASDWYWQCYEITIFTLNIRTSYFHTMSI